MVLNCWIIEHWIPLILIARYNSDTTSYVEIGSRCNEVSFDVVETNTRRQRTEVLQGWILLCPEQ